MTATDAKHAPYLFNAIASIRDRFPAHPRMYVYDLGMNSTQRRELSGIPWLELRHMNKFVAHWHLNWSWKPYILTQLDERYVFYFDAANIVLYRPLHMWFRAIQHHGYFLIGNGQKLSDITPTDYWPMFGLDPARYRSQSTFGAGLIGFDQAGAASDAIREALLRTREGWNLGRSAQEKSRVYDRSAVRQCPCFRADQTLLNLAFRKHYGAALIVRDGPRYCGVGGANDHPRQYLWYARRKRSSLIYFWTPLKSNSFIFWINRVTSYLVIATRYYVGHLRQRLLSFREHRVRR